MAHYWPPGRRRRPWPLPLALTLLLLAGCAGSNSPTSYCPAVIRPSHEAATWLIETPKPESARDWIDKITRQQEVFADHCR